MTTADRTQDPAAEATDLERRLLAGERRALARAMSLVEDGRPAAEWLLRSLFPRTGGAHRVGVTGPPGAGKSTLVEKLVLDARERDLAVGVIAVDPTSPFTGGALLGDRVRMVGLAGDPQVFIRSMATRGTLGGLATASMELADLLDAQGRQLILLETVGVGQSELEVARAADTTVVVLTPESGDGIQAMKAGLIEAGDIFVINKADRGGADRLRRSLEAALSWRELPEEAWRAPVLLATATAGDGVPAVAAAIESHREHLRATGRREVLRRERWRARVRAIVERRLTRRLWEDPDAQALLEGALGDGAGSPYEAADLLLARAGWGKAGSPPRSDRVEREAWSPRP